MPYYRLENRAQCIGVVEVTTHGTIKRATARFQWAVGKQMETLNEWLHAHHLRSTASQGSLAVDACRVMLSEQQTINLNH